MYGTDGLGPEANRTLVKDYFCCLCCYDIVYSAHWIYKPGSVIRVAVAIGSEAAITRD